MYNFMFHCVVHLQVWDHVSGKLKKDLQYQADVSYLSFFVCFSFNHKLLEIVVSR